MARYCSCSGHFDGATAVFSPIKPDKVSFWIRVGPGLVGSNQAAGYFVLSDSTTLGGGAFFFLAQGNGQFVLVPGDESFNYSVNTWYHVQFLNIDWSTKKFDYAVNDTLIRSGLTFRDTSVTGFSHLYLYSFTPNVEAWWDEISIGQASLPWLSFAPDSGTVAPGGSADVSLGLSARHLPGGNYSGTLLMTSNDPGGNSREIPVQMHVIGKPLLALSTDSADLGNAYIGGAATDTFRIRNDGSVNLTISKIVSDDSVFSAAPDSFSVGSHQSRDVIIRFAPKDTLLHLANLTIHSNDSTHLSTVLAIRGTGLFPPSIAVTPDSLSFTILRGDSASGKFTITNSGKGILSFKVRNTSLLLAAPAKDKVLPSKNGTGTYGNPRSVQGTLTLKAVVLRSYGTDYAMAAWDSLNANWGRYGFAAVSIDYTSFHSATITHDGLAASGADVLIISDAYSAGNGWQYSDAEWSAIARYVEEGHGLVATSGSLYSSGAPNNAAHLTPLLGLDSTASYFWSNPGSSMDFIQRSHPLLTNLTEPYSPGLLATAQPSGGSWYTPLRGGEVVAISPNNTTAIIAYRNRVYISNIPESTPGNAQDCQLMYNALVWSATAGAGWLSESPVSGTVPAGKSLEIAVKIRTQGLTGTNYTAGIMIDNNDPVHAAPVITVTLHLTGTGVRDGIDAIPKEFVLHQNYPNPFNPTTVIKYDLPTESRVRLVLYNILGEEVAVLQDGVQQAGYREKSVDGARLASGVFFYRLEATSVAPPVKHFVRVLKMALIK